MEGRGRSWGPLFHGITVAGQLARVGKSASVCIERFEVLARRTAAGSQRQVLSERVRPPLRRALPGDAGVCTPEQACKPPKVVFAPLSAIKTAATLLILQILSMGARHIAGGTAQHTHHPG